MPKRTLTQGVFPVAAQEGVATLLTTTPGEDNCYLNRVMERTDINGDPLLPVLRFGEPCSDCKLTTCPWKCKHNTGELPAWHSADKRGQMQFLVRILSWSLLTNSLKKVRERSQRLPQGDSRVQHVNKAVLVPTERSARVSPPATRTGPVHTRYAGACG